MAIVSLTVVDSRCQTTDNCIKMQELAEQGLYPKNEFVDIVDILTELIETRTVIEPSWKANSNTNVTIIFWELSATCRRYTDVLAFKDQLQNALFTNITTLINASLSKVTLLIIKLQTAAVKLQHIEANMTSRYCVAFTPEQYKLIYFSRLHHDNGLLMSLKERGLLWQDVNDYKLCSYN